LKSRLEVIQGQILAPIDTLYMILYKQSIVTFVLSGQSSEILGSETVETLY